MLAKKSNYINSSSLILLAFATAFFPRILDTAGAPSAINFVHFAIVPLVCAIALFKTRTRDRKQILVSKSLLLGLFIFLVVIFASAFLNDAGVVNAVIEFLLLAEPFILLLAMVCLPMSIESFSKIRNWLIGFAAINLVLSYLQYPLIASGHLSAGEFTPQDGTAGVFFVSGAGNYVSSSVSISFALYYFTSTKSVSIWSRAAVVFAALCQLQFSDAKQIIFALLVAWVLLVFINLKNIQKSIKLLTAITIFGLVFFWCMQNLEAFSGFNSWLRPELYGPNGAAYYAKFAGVRIALSYYESSLNWLLGLGPGHTVGRLGGWFIKDYWHILGPLGATAHPASTETANFMKTFWLTSLSGSSMFNPFFGWAGIWGDLGFLGLGAYFYLAYIVWRYLCLENFSKFLLFTVLVVGCIFTQMEEPGYMLSIAVIIGLKWQEHQILTRYGLKHRNIYSNPI